ncbi:MAG: hypothetical protein JRF60_18025 [Deltaproteobacteria bacterium]|jgi:hypothetical protein|nr:hypothetical protein [Deltaproteobacteria bacterium]
MKKIFSLIFLTFILFYSPAIVAQEHGGQEDAGKVIKQPTSQEIRDAMKDYVVEKSKKSGMFEIMDPATGKMRYLELEKVHERVGKTGNYFYSCADFNDTKSGQLLDLDLDVEHKNGKLNVVDVRIHKVAGKSRYTYDKDDNRIPVK